MTFIHKPRGIIHVGAGALEEAAYYDWLGKPPVIWVEARGLSKNHYATANRYGHHLVYAALSDIDEDAVLYHTDNGVSTSLLKLKDHPGVKFCGTERVKTHRADACFNIIQGISNYDTLVLDVQGAELKVLRGFGDLLDNFDWIISEVFYAELYENVPRADEVKAFLEANGFELVKEERNESGLWGDAMFKRAK